MSDNDTTQQPVPNQPSREHQAMFNSFLRQQAKANAVNQRIKKQGTMSASIRSRKNK